MKKLGKIDDRELLKITRSPEQYRWSQSDSLKRCSDYNPEEETRDISKYEGSNVVFDDMLDYNQKAIDPIFTRGRHQIYDVYNLS